MFRDNTHQRSGSGSHEYNAGKGRMNDQSHLNPCNFKEVSSSNSRLGHPKAQPKEEVIERPALASEATDRLIDQVHGIATKEKGV